jgi:hypothetical protein
MAWRDRYLTSLVLLGVLSGCLPTGGGRCDFESKPVPVTGVQTFSQALVGVSKVLVLDNQPGELIWLTQFSALAYEKGKESPSPQLLGESSLRFARPERHQQLLEVDWPSFEAVFGAAAGAAATRLPKGFGVPMLSNEPLTFQAGVVNFDAYQKATQVSVKGQLDFVRQRGLKQPMKPLLVRTLRALTALEPSAPVYGQWTTPGPLWPRPVSPETGEVTDPFGQRFQTFWTVSPGSAIATHRSEVTYALQLTRDTRLHHATAVVDPSVRSMRLVDQGGEVLALKALEAGDGDWEFTGFSSAEGVLLRADQRYFLELDCRPAKKGPVQASGRLYVYLEDAAFRWPLDD